MVNGLWRSWAWLCLKRWRSNIYHSICACANDFDTFETTEDRLTFLIHIPIHAGCGNKPATEKTTVITTEKSAIGSEKNGSGSEKSSEKNQAIISAIRLNSKVTAAEIAMKLVIGLLKIK